ncbi:MAG: hypothetical protein ACOCQL_00395 [Halolamina sp.]
MTRPITAIDVTARTLPLSESFPTSDGDLPTDHCYVRVSDGETVGYGEGAALRTFTGETAATMAVAAREHYAPAVADEPPGAALRALADAHGLPEPEVEPVLTAHRAHRGRAPPQVPPQVVRRPDGLHGGVGAHLAELVALTGANRPVECASTKPGRAYPSPS